LFVFRLRNFIVVRRGRLIPWSEVIANILEDNDRIGERISFVYDGRQNFDYYSCSGGIAQACFRGNYYFSHGMPAACSAAWQLGSRGRCHSV
jgi:hypothetical protein